MSRLTLCATGVHAPSGVEVSLEGSVDHTSELSHLRGESIQYLSTACHLSSVEGCRRGAIPPWCCRSALDVGQGKLLERDKGWRHLQWEQSACTECWESRGFRGGTNDILHFLSPWLYCNMDWHLCLLSHPFIHFASYSQIQHFISSSWPENLALLQFYIRRS